MLYIYRDGTQLPDKELVTDNNKWFDEHFLYSGTSIDEISEGIMQRIDKAFIRSESRITTPHAESTLISNLSTGSKTAINIHTFPEVIFDTVSCGSNALLEILHLSTGNAILHWFSRPYYTGKDFDISVKYISRTGEHTCTRYSELISLIDKENEADKRQNAEQAHFQTSLPQAQNRLLLKSLEVGLNGVRFMSTFKGPITLISGYSGSHKTYYTEAIKRAVHSNYRLIATLPHFDIKDILIFSKSSELPLLEAAITGLSNKVIIVDNADALIDGQLMGKIRASRNQFILIGGNLSLYAATLGQLSQFMGDSEGTLYTLRYLSEIGNPSSSRRHRRTCGRKGRRATGTAQTAGTSVSEAV